MEEQAMGLAEMVSNDTDRQLKEMFDSFSEEERKIIEHHANNESELAIIKAILDANGVPSTRYGVELSPSDRVRLALKMMRASA